MHVEMTPAAGEKLLRFVGDRLRFSISSSPRAAEAFLRTNLGRASVLHAEIVQEYRAELVRWGLPPIRGAENTLPRGMAWRDIPLIRNNDRWEAEVALTEVGFFQAKAYVVDEHGRQVWPGGEDIGITVHPDEYRTGNTVYCAFTRMFGPTKIEVTTTTAIDPVIERLDKKEYTVIPPSGKFRDLIQELPHIFDTLGCRILHLLPINPTPVTGARFGRFGSPYAAEDLTGIDPALVEFDRRSTGIEQFQELTWATHAKGGRVVLDIVINHTGWGSTLQENHPEWFLRRDNRLFVSPGAWGTVWEDLVELDHRMPLSWDYLADVFVTWCRRGVDGFRCDAGYKVPTAAWRYIIARVRHEFPNALFLLEGLGGAWEATEELLTRGGMQWAYSELFQNHSPIQVSGYLDHALSKSETVGTLIHYSETHDNDRLAARGRRWSVMRNQLCALAGRNGAFAFTCGVEWLAAEKINVHSSRGLAWGREENIIPELARLNQLLAEHPCFFDGASVRRISGPESEVLVLSRISSDNQRRLLVLVNLDDEEPHAAFLARRVYEEFERPDFDLLSERPVPVVVRGENVEMSLGPGQCICLALEREVTESAGKLYRELRAIHAWAISALSTVLEPEQIGPHAWALLAELVEENPRLFLASLATLHAETAAVDLLGALRASMPADAFPQVVEWTLTDRRRITPVPPGHWLLLQDEVPFRATLAWAGLQQHCASIAMGGRHFGSFAPHDVLNRPRVGPAKLSVERYGHDEQRANASILFLASEPAWSPAPPLPLWPRGNGIDSPLVLLTNGRGGMARMCVDLGEVKSKYDCVLGANLHPAVPVDRHIFVKRIRVWANADRLITPLNAANLQSFLTGPPARWEFAAIAGDGQVARIEMYADMLQEQNTTVFSFRLLDTSKPGTKVSLTVRFDIEDRNFHTQTEHNGGAEYHFSVNTRPLERRSGFEFRPAEDRYLRIHNTSGAYHAAPEWSDEIPHAMERARGQVGHGAAYSPGWFEIALERGTAARIIVTAEKEEENAGAVDFIAAREALNKRALERAAISDPFGRQLALAIQAFVVRRNEFKSIVAGYPWFLDWGRDSLICARGLISAGLLDEVKELLMTFGRFEMDGTLPNTIYGDDASNRDTSDAPLWYGVVCSELAQALGPAVYELKVDASGRTIGDVLRGIAVGYMRGTPNGIVMDRKSGLVWSPSHFTWMDTNFPAGTPREGYPIEIQALWIMLLRQLDALKIRQEEEPWRAIAERAQQALEKHFWIEARGWFADVLIAARGVPAERAKVDDALRSNCVIPIAFDLTPRAMARSCLQNVLRYLVVPGALRSLAPLSVTNPLPIHGSDWRLLNNPVEPYWGRYEGDEDTQRKPAYHNGTAWTWTFPGLAEGIVRAWDYSPEAREAAKAYLGSMAELLADGCLGQLPEVLDGDAPHTRRGCDAQAWGVTEALRVWKLLQNENPRSRPQ